MGIGRETKICLYPKKTKEEKIVKVEYHKKWMKKRKEHNKYIYAGFKMQPTDHGKEIIEGERNP